MQIKLTQVIAAAAGVLIFDLVFCGMIAPKVKDFIELQRSNKKACCAECEAGKTCKNITGHAQVIDMQRDSAFDPFRMVH